MSHNEVEEHEDFTNLWEIDFCDACFFLQDSKMLPKGHQIKQTKYMHDINISNFPPEFVKLAGNLNLTKDRGLFIRQS